MAELRFKIIGDDTDIRKKFKELSNLQADSGKAFDKAFKSGSQGAKSAQDILGKIVEETKSATTATQNLSKAQSSSSANAAKEAQLAYMDSLRQSRLEIQKQREEQARLRVSYDEGRISQQQYRIEAAKFSLEERKKAAALRETKKEISNNSEYQKLNRALSALRTESKNLLAEMYRLETQGKKGSIAYQELANKARGVVAQTNVLDGALKKIDASLGLHQRNVGNYGSALDAVSPQFARLNSQLSMMGVNLTEVAGQKNSFKELGTTLMGVGKNIGMFLLSPVGLVITGLTALYALITGNAGTVKTFNSGLLNVSKTTGIAGAELDKMGDSVIRLSRDLEVIGTEKLMEYGTVAGQLGVKGTKDIMAFTEALAKLETASNIKGEEGGSQIARLLTLTDGGVQNIKDFGDEIVNLGNNFAATEKEILENAEAISQNVGLYRIGRQDVLAYATATKAVGLEAEVVGSTFNRTLAEFEKTIRTGKGLSQTLAIIGGSADELQKRFKTDAAGVFNDYIAGLNKIHIEGGSVNKALTETGVIAVRDQRVIASLATNGFDVLTNALVTVKDATGALDKEFETAAEKLENQTKRIGIAWRNLVLDIENGTGALGKAAVWLSGTFADALDRISKMVAPTGWNEFIASLTSFQAADVIREINQAVDGVQGAMNVAEELNINPASVLKISNSKEIEDALGGLVSAQDKATKSLNLYKSAIESGLLTDAGKIKVTELEGLLNRLSSRINQVSMFVPATTTGGTSSSGEPTTPAITEAEQRALETMVNAQRAMQAKIDGMNQSAKRKNLKDGEDEVQAIKDKYKKLTDEAKLFNANPKNKIKVNMSGLGASESGEISEATYKADTVLLKKGLDEQLKLYDDFEALRKSTSLKVAEERYKDQLDLVKSYEPKLQAEITKLEVNSNRSKEEEKRYKLLTDDAKKFNEARLKEEDSAFIAAYNAAMTHYDRLEKIESDYQAKVKSLEDDAVRNGKTVSDEKINILKKDRDDAVQIANDEAFKKSEIYNQLAEETLVITRAQIKEQIKAIEELLSDGSITGPLKSRLEAELSSLKINLNFGAKNFNLDNLKAEKDNIQQAINKYLEINKLDAFDSLTQSAINTHPELKALIARLQEVAAGIIKVKKSADDGGTRLKGFLAKLEGNEGLEKFSEWGQMASGAFSDMSNALGGVDTQAGYALNTVGELVGVAADIGGAIASGNPVQIVGSIVKGISSVFSIGKRVKEMNAAARKEVADFYAQAITGEKEYQALLNERAINSVRDNKIRLLGIRDEIALRKKQADADAKEFKEIISRVRGQQYIQDQTYKHGTWFRKAKVTNVMGSLQGKSFEDLSTLLSQGKLEGETMALVERLVELEQKGYDAAQALADLAKETNEIFTGTTADNLTDSLSNMFREGKTGAQDLANFFESTMSDAAMSIFKNKVLAGMMEDFYKDFATAAESDDKLTAGEIDTLRTKWMTDTANAQKQWDQIQEVTGLPQGGNSSGSNNLTNSIGDIQEVSANNLLKLFLCQD